jgi:hypothetical protein
MSVASRESRVDRAPVEETLVPRGGKALPKYIWIEKGGVYRIKINRGKLRFMGSVRLSEPDALDRAIRIRDQFLKAAGPVLVPLTHGAPAGVKSNTGYRGICETTKWTKYRPRPCFMVEVSRRPRKLKIFCYGPRVRSREEALRLAIELRNRTVGGVS